MSQYRLTSTRGPPENHVVDRYLSTYAADYRTYEPDDVKHHIPIRCSPAPTRSADQPSNHRQWSNGLARGRAWDGHRPRLFYTSTSASSSGKPQYTSTYNTTVGEKSPITVTPIAPYTPTNLREFGQMFSQIARINDHLYLSSLSALTVDRLKQHRITLLVSATVDPPPAHLRNSVASSMHVAVEDVEGASLRPYFDRVVDRIAQEHRRGGRALVHCMAGVSRSSTLVMAYLIRHQHLSLADAYQHVRRIRPCIQPNPGFWRQLIDYEERLRGTRSVRLLPAIGYPPTRAQLDLFSKTSGDLLPYRPLNSVHNLDSGKPYIGCRQPFG